MITPSIICPPISIPIQLLIKPFRQRFQFHFTGTRQTNRLDKPEWYFTKILKWIQENQQFVSQSFQPVAIKSGLSDLNCRVSFFWFSYKIFFIKLNLISWSLLEELSS